MNQPSDDSEIREFVQRLKHADYEHVPSFEDVLNLPRRESRRRSKYRLQLAAAGCAAVVLLSAFFHALSQQDNSTADVTKHTEDHAAPANSIRIPPDGRVAEIDFTHLNHVIEEHWSTSETAVAVGTRVWSSRSESLLVLNLTNPLNQE